ncbi:hypothetical protein NP493_1092g00045 [Ridgeia piscesae]|uniref:Uncharacterized protein n=1 Tax=Ridgeia piscesae TaxID=27915 RepID=A0AAD9KHD9_RIDPI|nr:hypothetical protein NP493_1092g00045 [Ridgeia piscesae]
MQSVDAHPPARHALRVVMTSRADELETRGHTPIIAHCLSAPQPLSPHNGASPRHAIRACAVGPPPKTLSLSCPAQSGHARLQLRSRLRNRWRRHAAATERNLSAASQRK